MHNKNKGLGSR